MSLSEHTKNGDYMLEIGQLFDKRYKILDIIGSGGMSTVYLVLDALLNCNVVMKGNQK